MLSKQDWKEIIYTNGRVNLTQVFKELADYAFLMEQASKVYSYFTSLSKTHYHSDTIIALIEERTYDKPTTQYDIGNIIKNCSTKKELIKEIREYFDLPTPGGK